MACFFVTANVRDAAATGETQSIDLSEAPCSQRGRWRAGETRFPMHAPAQEVRQDGDCRTLTGTSGTMWFVRAGRWSPRCPDDRRQRSRRWGGMVTTWLGAQAALYAWPAMGVEVTAVYHVALME